jgi:LiaI-LiaF-like transmembrane region
MAEITNPRCRCPRCTIRGLRGPAVLITLGILFLLSEMQGSYFSIGHTWPVILLVLGAMSLACSVAPMDGHIEPVNAGSPPPMPPPYVPPAPPPVPPPGSLPGQRP